MGRLLASGFETLFYGKDGVKKVVLSPKDCHRALWDPVDSVDGATAQVLLDILASDPEFYGRLFGTRHLAAHLAEPAKEQKEWSAPLRRLEFRWYAERWFHDHGHPDGDLEVYPDVVGIGKSENSDDAGGSGEDVGYALDFTPLASLAGLPVVVLDVVEMHVYGEDRGEDSKSTLGRMPLRLADLLMALVDEASFHGSPEDRDERLDDLKDRAKEVEADIASGKIRNYVTLDEVMDDVKARFLLDNGGEEAKA